MTMKSTIEKRLSTAIRMTKIDWQQPEENSGAFTTGLNYFDEIGPSDCSDYDTQHFDEQAFGGPLSVGGNISKTNVEPSRA